MRDFTGPIADLTGRAFTLPWGLEGHTIRGVVVSQRELNLVTVGPNQPTSEVVCLVQLEDSAHPEHFSYKMIEGLVDVKPS